MISEVQYFNKVTFVRAVLDECPGTDAGLVAWWYTDKLPWSAEADSQEVLQAFYTFQKAQGQSK